MSDLTVSNTIVEQLGGHRRLKVMINAKDFLGDNISVQFKFMKGADGINGVRITLTPDDLYEVEFFRGLLSVKKIDGIYNDQLREIFRQVTGLALSL